MPNLFRAVVVLSSLALAAGSLPAHGGIYPNQPPRAMPGDVVPPGPGGGGRPGGPVGPTTPGPTGPAPTTPGPAAAPAGAPAGAPGPTTPSGAGPATGSPTAPMPAGGGRGPTTPRGGIVLEEDASRWDLWWELHQDPFLRLKNALHQNTVQTGSDDYFLGSTRSVDARNALAVTDDDIANLALPALASALRSSDQRDMVTAAMVALAKIGLDHRAFGQLKDLLAPRLMSLDQEVRETAALALGIAGQTDAGQVELLSALARDEDDGRKACGRSEVDYRTRAFACYGLGLLSGSAKTLAARFRAVTPLVQLVGDDSLRQRDVKTAAILALGLLDAGGRGDAALRAMAVQALGEYYGQRRGQGLAFVQAQCPPVIARLLDRDGVDAAQWRQRFADQLQGADTESVKAQSCAMALGTLCRPGSDDRDDDAKARLSLLRTFRDHGDAQTRNFAIMALGRIGGAHARTLLLGELANAGKAMELPWVALALGVQAHARRQHGDVDRTTVAALRELLGRTKNPSTLGALAIALGLCGDRDALPDLAALLQQKRNDEQLCGYVCLALGLLGDRAATTDVRAVLQHATRRPMLLRQAAIALGVLGDGDVTSDLLQQLGDGDTNLARLSAIAVALGLIGDRRTLPPLTRLLQDDSLVALSRALCAAALGNVCDRRLLPWNTPLRDYANYRASIETLWDGSAGILDIL